MRQTLSNSVWPPYFPQMKTPIYRVVRKVEATGQRGFDPYPIVMQ